MKRSKWVTQAMLCAMASLLLTPAMAAEDPAVGTWLLKSDFNGRTMNSLLLISKNDEGSYQGKWVSFWGITDVDDLKIADGKVSFTQTNQFRDQEFTLEFEGTLKDGKLSGTMYSDQWDNDMEGSRIKPFEPVVGVWEFRRQRGDREFVTTMTVSRDEKGQFGVNWEGGRRRPNANNDNSENPWEISDVNYADGKLTFTRKNTNPERQFEMTYALSADGDTITGTMTTPRGERETEGKRLHGDLIGKWELTMSSDFGDRKQFLWIQPDLTAWFGSTNVGNVKVEDGTVSFDYEMSFGDRSFENAFTGKLQNGTLTGEMSNSQGTQQVKGKKMGS